MKWNHNINYHDVVMSAVPSRCQRALDAGCGQGALARKLAQRCREVIAMDVDRECLAFAKAAAEEPNVTLVQGDVLEEPLPEESFDFVVALATLHHLPLRIALERFRKLLRSGGVLVIVGLYRSATPIDYACGAIALPISWAIRMFKGTAHVGAPVREPTETLREIRAACDTLLPGGVFQRQLFFRYTFVWRKP